MIKFRRDDVSKAHRTIALCRKLTGDQMRIAATLIESFNASVDRTTISHGRLCAILNVHEKTVRRAVAKLCQLGMFERCSFGGGSRSAAYRPNWAMFRSFIRDLSARMRALDREQEAGDAKAET